MARFTVDELELKKARWFLKGQESGTFAMLRFVVAVLGESVPERQGQARQWRGPNDLAVFFNLDEKFITATIKSRVVCCDHPDVQLFVPGEWEESVAQAHRVAQANVERDKSIMEEDRRRQLLHDLWLDDDRVTHGTGGLL